MERHPFSPSAKVASAVQPGSPGFRRRWELVIHRSNLVARRDSEKLRVPGFVLPRNSKPATGQLRYASREKNPKDTSRFALCAGKTTVLGVYDCRIRSGADSAHTFFRPLNDSKSRRDYFRINTVLPFSYCLIEEPHLPEPRRAKLNLSLGGVGFVTNRRLKLDDMLLIAVALPSPPVLHVVGRVVRIEPAAGDGSDRIIGARFANLKLRDEDRLNKYIVALDREGLNHPDEG